MEKYELYHHGIKGQKWGVRRYQNADGSLTAAGKKRQAKQNDKDSVARGKELHKQVKKGTRRVDELDEAQLKDLKNYTDKAGKNAVAGALAVVGGVAVTGAAAAGIAGAVSVRKEKNKAEPEKKQDDSHEDYKRAHEKVDVKNLSTADLMKIKTRLKAESEYEKIAPKDKSKLEKTKDLVDASSKGLETATKEFNRYAPQKREKIRMNLDNMSDKEMREKINRELLERQYNDLFAPEKVNRGREFARTALTVGGTALSVAGTALTIAVAIKDLKKGSS